MFINLGGFLTTSAQSGYVLELSTANCAATVPAFLSLMSSFDGNVFTTIKIKTNGENTNKTINAPQKLQFLFLQ